MEHKRSITAPLVVVLAMVLLPLLYVGAYLATVDRVLFVKDHRSGLIVEAEPFYRLGEEQYVGFLRPVFYPVHIVDRFVRPKYWSIDLERFGQDFDFDTAEPAQTSIDDMDDRLPTSP